MMAAPVSILCVHWTGQTSLAVTWRDGRCVCVDLAGWIASGGAALAALKDPRRFSGVRIGDGGTQVLWGATAIAADHLARIAEEQRAFSRSDIATWQAELGLSNAEAADFLGIALSTWQTYKAGTNPVPAPVAMVCRAALRDPILRQARYRPRMRGRPRKSRTERSVCEFPVPSSASRDARLRSV